MTAIVRLHDVINALEMADDNCSAYLNTKTGEIVHVTDEDRSMVEADELPDYVPDWQLESLPKVREALESDDYIELPSKFDIHEYQIMERFCFDLDEGDAQDECLRAIRGSGAFRY